MHWRPPAWRSRPAAALAVGDLARSRNCARCAPALAANRPRSSARPTPSAPGPLASNDTCPLSRQPSASRKSDCPDRCTTRRTALGFRSLPAGPPAPFASILPSPVARSRSRWWRHPGSRSSRTTARRRTIGVSPHARHRPPFSSPAVLAAFSSARHQPRSLQRLLHEGVAQMDAMLFAELLMKVPHVQIEVGVPVQTQHLLHLGHRHPPVAGLAFTPVHQPRIAVGLQPFPPSPHGPIGHPDDLGCFPPGDLLCHCLQQHVL